MKKLIFLLLTSMAFMKVNSQQVISFYNNNIIPGSKSSTNKEYSEILQDGVLIIHNTSVPTLSVYLPDPKKANGTAVIICPGGGYSILAYKHEGTDVAKLLNNWGITVFVLKYRIPNDTTMINKSMGPLQDLQEAIVFVRDHAQEYKLSNSKLGIMGFSAGGHLAASAATHFNKAVLIDNNNKNLRPDFLMLIYPVISFSDSFGHIGSRDNLLGHNPSNELIAFYNNESQVTKQTPPAFLVHAGDDNTVAVQNSISFYQALHKYNIPASLNIYQAGGHGFGMNNPTTTDKWTERLRSWLLENNFIN